MNAAIRQAIEDLKPGLRAEFDLHVRSLFAYLTQKFGPELEGLLGTQHWKEYREVIRPLERYRPLSSREPPSLDDAKVEKAAQKYADDAARTWIAKIEAKLGELDSADIKHLSGVNFLITGTRKGHSVQIEQQMITNVSSKKRPFNQFPARIHVDGRPTSEKAYQQMFAARATETGPRRTRSKT